MEKGGEQHEFRLITLPFDMNAVKKHMENYHHFIVTRFNVNIYPIDFPARLEDTWLALRFELFQKYCFPTVSAQTNQDFTWLVLFDEQTPSRYKRFIDVYDRYENFTPLYCGDYSTIVPTIAHTMRAMAPDARWLVSTRLDNDDALSVEFVNTLHTLCNQLSEEDIQRLKTLYVNFTNGLQYHEGQFYDFSDVTNAFVSLIESSQSPETVFWVDHPAIHDACEVMQVSGPPLWLQIVHDMNVYNYLRGEKTAIENVSERFPCSF